MLATQFNWINELLNGVNWVPGITSLNFLLPELMERVLWSEPCPFLAKSFLIGVNSKNYVGVE